MPRPVILSLSQSPSYLPPPRNIKPQKTPAQAPANPRQSSSRLHARACPHINPASRNTSCTLPSVAQAREHDPPSSHTPPHSKHSHRHAHPSIWPHQPRPHADSCSAAACCCHPPATTPTPNSPLSTGPGEDASSGPLAVEKVPFIAIPVGPRVDASTMPFTIEVLSFISVPTPQHKTPKDPRPSTRKPPSVTAPPPRSRMPSHNPRLAPTPASLSPLLRRRAGQMCSSTPRHYTRPRTLSSLTGTLTPPSGRTRLARTLPRPAAATPLPRHDGSR
jgi:hypothetical protein